MDKIRALTVFRRVVELGSFTAAADDLNLSKAAVSKNINELEHQLKNPLIHRTTRQLHITDLGHRYYQQVCHILDALHQADSAVIESSETLRGTLKVSTPMSLGLIEINPLVCQFMQRHPELAVEVHMSDQHVDLIEQGVDVAIRGGGALSNNLLRARKLADIQRILCAAPSYLKQAGTPHDPQQLLEHRILSYSLSSSARTWQFRQGDQCQNVLLPNSHFVVNSGLALTEAALAGLGVALLPDFFVQQALKEGKLIALLPDWQLDAHALHIVYPDHKEQAPKVRAFIDFIAAHFRA